jgi:hypothetical protein
MVEQAKDWGYVDAAILPTAPPTGEPEPTGPCPRSTPACRAVLEKAKERDDASPNRIAEAAGEARAGAGDEQCLD